MSAATDRKPMHVRVAPADGGRHKVRVECATTVGGQAVLHDCRESYRAGPASKSEWCIHHADHPNRQNTWYMKCGEGAPDLQREDHTRWECGCVSLWAYYKREAEGSGHGAEHRRKQIFGVAPLHVVGAGRYGLRDWCGAHGTRRVDAVSAIARPAPPTGPAYRTALAAATRRLGAAGVRAAAYATLVPPSKF